MKFGQDLLTLGLTVIIEWGTWARSERDRLRLGARSLGAAVELHRLSAPIDVLFKRIQRRGMENPPIERDRVIPMGRDIPRTDARRDCAFRRSLLRCKFDRHDALSRCNF